MRPETIKEFSNGPLQFIFDYRHMVVPIDYGLSFLVPWIISLEGFFVMIMVDPGARPRREI